MRRFNSIEKEIISILAETSNNNVEGVFFVTLIDPYLKNFEIDVSIKENTVKIWYNKELEKSGNEYDLINGINYISYIIVLIVNLIKYLEQQGLIIVYKRTNVDKNNFSLGQLTKEEKSESKFPFPDELINSSIINLLDKSILVNDDLQYYIKHKYRTQEEINQRNNLTVAWVGVAISFLIGIASIFISIHTSSQPIKIDDKQMLSINDKLSEISTNILLINKPKKMK